MAWTIFKKLTLRNPASNNKWTFDAEGDGLVMKLNGTAVQTYNSTTGKPGVAGNAHTVSYTIGAEAADVIRVTGQVKDSAGTNLASITQVTFWVSENSAGVPIAPTAPTGGIAVITGALIGTVTASKAITLTTNTSGVFVIDITDTGAKTFYAVTSLLNGSGITVSNAVTFA